MLGASTVYGDKFIDYQSHKRQPHPGAWDLKNIISQHFLLSAPMQIRSSPTSAVNQENRDIFISRWPEKKDPFTQADLLDSEEAQVQELIFWIRTSISTPYWEGLTNRLVTLFNDAKEEDPASPGISVGSLRNFYNFFQSHTDLKCPTISLTPDNNIYASWRVDQKKVFSVLILPNGDSRFVIFKPNDLHPERQTRISGTTTTDMLKTEVAPHGVWDWISE
ncbi:MAG: hypothetical protein KGZ49_01770 [Syntrophaceae bacterium]|nr:hypothetical protein [Syntrophaceae bacterium]